MRTIKIPDYFQSKLRGTDEQRLVEIYLSTFDDWYQLNETVFFREYSDHGPRHIETVLETAEHLLTDESKVAFSSADTALLICSTLLHDFAMHLQEDSFVSLAQSDAEPVGKADFGDLPWSRLWKDYVSEIHRVPDNTRYNLFGTAEPIVPPDLEDTQSWTQPQFRYIGEFIRRNHPRLAAEITSKGLPGTEGTFPIQTITADDPCYRLSMLSGLVARSHGMNLRDTFDVLRRDYHIRVFAPNCRPIFVMVLLRIADYLQLQSTRAPGNLLKLKRLRSPLSQSEWGLHDAIRGVSFDAEDDPEVLQIQVDPQKSDVESYLKTKRLLASIQNELDSSWAVLGEVFGRFPNENWGITVRRIRSNIEDKETFGRSAGFIPEEVKFTSANTELTKLLIKPLYGDYPEIAVRELVQNAVDACRERAFLDGAKSKQELEKYAVDVSLIKAAEGGVTLRISDSGIGMTLEVLQRYFLNAGSSFRTSMAWKKHFSSDDSKSEVLRSGRFGVGALAAFLVADDPSEISLTVHSRHANSRPEDAVFFETSLSDAPISVSYKTKQDIGTEISVTTASPPAFMRAKESEGNQGQEWDWHCLDWPRVQRTLTTGKKLSQRIHLPEDTNNLSVSGRRANYIDSPGFDSVMWYYGDGHHVVCNGIRVVEKKLHQLQAPNLFEEKTMMGPHSLKFPCISVMDKDGLLPLTLDRLRLDFDQVPFMRELRQDVLISLICGLACAAPSSLKAGELEKSQRRIARVLEEFEGTEAKAISWICMGGSVSVFSGRSLEKTHEQRVVEISRPKDVSFIDDASKVALILGSRSVLGSQQGNKNVGRRMFIPDDRDERMGRDRDLERLREEVDELRYRLLTDGVISIVKTF